MRARHQQSVLLTVGCMVVWAHAAVASATFPPMKPGFWQASMVMHMDIPGQPPDTDNTPDVTYSCQSAQTMADAMKKLGGVLPGCTFDFEGSDGSYTIATNCTNMGGMPGKLTASGTMVFNGQTEMVLKETSSMVAPSMSMKSDISNDSKWIGECPAGVAPGDFGKMVNGTFQKQGNYADLAKIKMPSVTGN